MGCCAGHKIIEYHDKFNYNKNFQEEKNLQSANDLKLFSSNLVYGSKEPFNKFYKIYNSVGSGSFGKVYKCQHLLTGQIRAIKVVKIPEKKDNNKDKEREDKVFKEIELLAQLDHPHIMKIYEYYKDDYNYFIATEFMEGGDLYDYISKLKSFNEADAAKIMNQLLSAVNYLHSKGIVHRDLKPENIMIENSCYDYEPQSNYRTKKDLKEVKSDDNQENSNSSLRLDKDKDKEVKINTVKRNSNLAGSSNKRNSKNNDLLHYRPKKVFNSSNLNIKIIDFGASCFIEKNQYLNNKVGTPYYIAPEVLRKEYNNKCDIWSLGVILYILLIGRPPFDGRSTEVVFQKIQSGKFEKGGSWHKISHTAKDLISKMLTFNFRERPTAKECLDHAFLQTSYEPYTLSTTLHEQKKDNFLNFQKPSQYSSSNLGGLADNNASFVSKEEKFKEVLDNLKKFSVKNKFQQATIAYLVRHVANKELFDELKEIFEAFDTDKDGILSYEEIKEGLNKYYPTSKEVVFDFDEIIKKLDQDSNNQIEYEEFLRNMVNMKSLLTKQNLQIAFNMFDTDKNGVLSIQEIRDALGVVKEEDDRRKNGVIDKIVNSIDTDGDGTISFEEFYELMMNVLDK